MVKGGLWLLGLLSLSTTAWSLEIESSAARYHDRRYQFEMVAWIDAPMDKVSAVLRDYAHYPRLDAHILEARVLERPDDRSVVLGTVLRACFGPFCRNVRRVERVEEAPLELTAIVDPARSDVRFGETRTRLSVSGERVRVEYHTSVEPGFWLPPLVGRRWMLRTLQQATVELFRNVEAQAQLK